jgi:hypothetical protein
MGRSPVDNPQEIDVREDIAPLMDARKKKAPKKTAAKKPAAAKLNGHSTQKASARKSTLGRLNGRAVQKNGKKRTLLPKAKLAVRHTNGAALAAPPTVLDAVGDGFEAVLDAVLAANERGYRVSRTLVDQARDAQRDALGFAQLWAEAPLDPYGFASAIIDVTANAQIRALRGASQWVEELSLAQEEANDTIRRVAFANRSAGEAVVEGARGMLAQAADFVYTAL